LVERHHVDRLRRRCPVGGQGSAGEISEIRIVDIRHPELTGGPPYCCAVSVDVVQLIERDLSLQQRIASALGLKGVDATPRANSFWQGDGVCADIWADLDHMVSGRDQSLEKRRLQPAVLAIDLDRAADIHVLSVHKEGAVAPGNE